MQQQNVINTTNAITTYCFKFHPPFLSPEVLSVCRLSLSIVNLLAVPLLSAAAIPSSARPVSFSHLRQKVRKTTVFRTRWRVRTLSGFCLQPTGNTGPKNATVFRTRWRVHPMHPRHPAMQRLQAVLHRSWYDWHCSLLPMRTLYPMQGGFPIAILYLPLI